MKKVNILMIRHPKNDNDSLVGGSEKSPYRIAKFLAQEDDIKVNFFYFIGPKSSDDRHLISVPTAKLYLTTLFREIGILFNWSNISKADIIQIHHPHYGLLLGIMRWITNSKVKILIKAHGTAYKEFHASRKNGFRGLILTLNNHIHLWHDRLALRFADYCICSSNYQKMEMKIIYGVEENKLVTIYNGYDPDFFPKSGILRKQKSILVVARAVAKKNIKYAVNLFNNIRAIDSDFSLTIVAGRELNREDPPISLYLKNLENNTEKIRILYDLSEDKLAELYAESHIFLMPSVGYESIPSVLYEAMVSGCIIFSAYDWGIPEILPDNVALSFNIDKDTENILNTAEHRVNKDIKMYSYKKLTHSYKKLYV